MGNRDTRQKKGRQQKKSNREEGREVTKYSFGVRRREGRTRGKGVKAGGRVGGWGALSMGSICWVLRQRSWAMKDRGMKGGRRQVTE